MNKKSCVYLLGISALVVVIFNLFAIVVNKSFEENFWSGYLFTMLGFVLVNVLSFASFYVGKNKNRNLFYAMHIVLFSLLYIVIQVFAGVCVIFVDGFDLTASVIVQLLLLIFYFAVVCILMFYKSNTEASFKATQENREFKNDMLKQLEIIIADTSNEQGKALLEKVYEQVYYESENMSNDSSRTLEKEIVNKLGMLEAFVESNNIEAIKSTCVKISSLLKQRDTVCKNRL